MAGVGFELRKFLKRESFSGLLQAYGFAGVISSGPWILSILGIMIIGIFSVGIVLPTFLVMQFLVSVTYLIAVSMILTGPLQLLFTRFVSDRLYEKKENVILPNLLGAITLTTLVSGSLGFMVIAFLFHEPFMYRLLMLTSFVTLCNIWVVVLFLSGLKAYRTVLWAFIIGYGITVVAALTLRFIGMEGLLAGFLLGQAVLFFLLLTLVLRTYPGNKLVAFDFLRRHQIYYSLAGVGFFYNLGIFADKFIFWINPITSEPIIGPLRASIVYDLPIFLAYLSIFPGMAVFLVRMETDFVEQYDAFYTKVREGDTLESINQVRDNMVFTVRQGIYEIFRVQGLTVLFFLIVGPKLLQAIKISSIHIHLFNVDVVAVGVQVLLLAILNVFFYLDERRIALFLSLLFALSNIIFTLVTQHLGPYYYGYGFATAVVVTSFVGLVLLSRKLDHLEYETFMLHRYS